MEQNTILRIIRKYLSGRFSPQTEEKVKLWILKDQDAQEKEKASLIYWNELKAKSNAETYAALKRVNQRIGYQKARAISFFQKLARTAAVLIPLFIIAGGYLYYTSTRNNQIELYAAYGERKHVLLPDSSEIWLNAGTRLTYPSEFAGNQRLVRLDGEAYFSVKRNTEKPFIVETSQLSVKVLGTKFNVKAYSEEEQITTTLTSGKVEINIPSQNPNVLKPNEQLTYTKSTSHVSITEVPTADTDSWVTGKLIFTNASFTEIQQIVERRFNVVIENATSIPASRRYTIRFLQDENVDEVLNVLKEIIGFNYRKNKNQILLTPES